MNKCKILTWAISIILGLSGNGAYSQEAEADSLNRPNTYNADCRVLNLNGLHYIFNARTYEAREKRILELGYTFSKEIQEAANLFNPDLKSTRRYYIKCDTTNKRDYFCAGAIVIVWNLDENTITYNTDYGQTYTDVYMKVRFVNKGTRMTPDVTLDQINRSSKDKYVALEVFCGISVCYVFMILEHNCDDGSIKKVYQIALSGI